MSLYNMVFGKSPFSEEVLGMLKLKEEDFGRFRDAWIRKDENGGFEIVIHTRNGGISRQDFPHVFEAMKKLPLYRSNKDVIDNTYCDFHFSIEPKDYETAKDIYSKTDQTPMTKERYKLTAEILKPGSPTYKKMTQIWEKLYKNKGGSLFDSDIPDRQRAMIPVPKEKQFFV